jgi:hypothetical protein
MLELEVLGSSKINTGALVDDTRDRVRRDSMTIAVVLDGEQTPGIIPSSLENACESNLVVEINESDWHSDLQRSQSNCGIIGFLRFGSKRLVNDSKSNKQRGVPAMGDRDRDREAFLRILCCANLRSEFDEPTRP